jgi:hypothetical protein
MVAMGGGPEYPAPDGESRRELLLAVLPWPQSQSAKIIQEIKSEFPNFDFQYFEEPYAAQKKDRGKVEVPEGN